MDRNTGSPERISRREVIVAGAAAGLAAGLPPLVQAAAPAQPNIIWIMADDLGFADTGFTGLRDLRTPNIDRIAQQGLFLRQSYSNSAVCTSTRVGLITGRYQYRLEVGLHEPLAGAEPIGLAPSHPTLPSMLRKAGYRTALVGKWHMGEGEKFGQLLSGYDRFYGFMRGAADYFRHQPESLVDGVGSALIEGDQPSKDIGYLTDLLGQRAEREIAAAAKDRAPLFLSLHFNAPHWPWEGPEDKAVAESLKAVMHYDGGNLATYRKMLLSMDSAIGGVLKAIDRAGATRDTIVIFTSDNGGERFSDTWPFTGQKTELLEGGIRVPFFIRWPARIKAGSRSEQVNISMDWVPTLLAAAGAAPDAAYPSDGENLLDVITGKSASRPRRLFWRFKAAEQAAHRDGDWKYLKLGRRESLFNLAEDEHERANYATKEPARMAAMKQAWAAWNATMLPYPANSISASPNTPDRY
ncbi:MAG: sulfatase-like hydrolase/transferase [Proteobacteria bacterium]|nr:sulfatase-like hydrolase/transferase [Pseudomonadota bacterium]